MLQTWPKLPSSFDIRNWITSDVTFLFQYSAVWNKFLLHQHELTSYPEFLEKRGFDPCCSCHFGRLLVWRLILKRHVHYGLGWEPGNLECVSSNIPLQRCIWSHAKSSWGDVSIFIINFNLCRFTLPNIIQSIPGVWIKDWEPGIRQALNCDNCDYCCRLDVNCAVDSAKSTYFTFPHLKLSSSSLLFISSSCSGLLITLQALWGTDYNLICICTADSTRLWLEKSF